MSASLSTDLLSLTGPLTGSKVLLRLFSPNDITNVYLGWLQDPEVVRFSSQRFRVHTRESCYAYLASFLGTSNHFLVICDRNTGETWGTMTIYHNVHHETADIGILLGERKIWGQGVGAEAFCLVIHALKDSGIIRKVTAGALSVNKGMVRIMEKAGMTLESTRYAHELLDGVPVNVVNYALFFNG